METLSLQNKLKICRKTIHRSTEEGVQSIASPRTNPYLIHCLCKVVVTIKLLTYTEKKDIFSSNPNIIHIHWHLSKFSDSANDGFGSQINHFNVQSNCQIKVMQASARQTANALSSLSPAPWISWPTKIRTGGARKRLIGLKASWRRIFQTDNQTKRRRRRKSENEKATEKAH